MADCHTVAPRPIVTNGVSQDDWGLLYGCGLFETVRVRDGHASFLDEHLDRLCSSAAHLDFAPGIDRAEIVERTSEFCRQFDDRVVRLTLTQGNPDLGLPSSLFFSSRACPYAAADRTAGIAVHIASTRRNETSGIVGHKTLNQLENIQAWADAQRHGCRESLFLNTAGQLAEGSRSNVFVVNGGDVFTPSIACGLLPGITRRVVIDALRAAGVRVHEGLLSLDALLECDECFLTSAVMEVMPVSRIDNRQPRARVPGPLTSAAVAAYAATSGRAIARVSTDV
jgi:branched-chain amino acid aminotransferase